MYRRKQNPATLPQPASGRTPTYDEWHGVVFDAAVEFTVVSGRRLETRQRLSFTSFPDAVEAAKATPHSVTYAIDAQRQSVVLDYADLADWLDRWHRNMAASADSGENVRMDTTTEDVNTTTGANTAPDVGEAVEAGSVFLLHWNGRGPGTAVIDRFADRASAEEYRDGPTLGEERTAVIIESPLDFSRDMWKMPTMVTLWNGRFAKNNGLITKFESLARGQERLYDGLVSRFGRQPLTIVTPPVATPGPAKVKRQRMTETATKKKSETSAPRSAAIRPTQVIKHVEEPNTKRLGTTAHDSYVLAIELAHQGKTVGDYLAEGGHRGQLWWNVKCGKITLSD